MASVSAALPGFGVPRNDRRGGSPQRLPEQQGVGTERDEDGLIAARGVLGGVLISLLFWAVVLPPLWRLV